MRQIAKVTLHHHELDRNREHGPPVPAQRVLHLFRVIGKSPSAADQLCRERMEHSMPSPSVVVTFEGVDPVGKAQIAVCHAIKQTCGTLHRSFHLCGVTERNRTLLDQAGLLEGLDRQNIHDSVAALLQSLSAFSTQRQGGRSRLRFPNPSAPFTLFLPADTLEPPMS